MMFQEQSRLKNVAESKTRCAGVHELIDWEIMQYRNAVDAHRLELTKHKGRYVGWEEAEENFASGDCVSLAERWRVEYCGLVCPHRRSCLLAVHFLHSKHVEQLHKAG